LALQQVGAISRLNTDHLQPQLGVALFAFLEEDAADFQQPERLLQNEADFVLVDGVDVKSLNCCVLVGVGLAKEDEVFDLEPGLNLVDVDAGVQDNVTHDSLRVDHQRTYERAHEEKEKKKPLSRKETDDGKAVHKLQYSG
jgi:hypothetical protein